MEPNRPSGPCYTWATRRVGDTGTSALERGCAGAYTSARSTCTTTGWCSAGLEDAHGKKVPEVMLRGQTQRLEGQAVLIDLLEKLLTFRIGDGYGNVACRARQRVRTR